MYSIPSVVVPAGGVVVPELDVVTVVVTGIQNQTIVLFFALAAREMCRRFTI